MDNWDQSKLESVVKSKHNTTNANKPTDIVCKYFLEAIEDRKYGWFWTCPNGGNECKYRHALPPGYVLKKKETEEERREREQAETENAITIEEFLETERHNLGPNLTPITFESFTKWKEERKRKKQEEEEALAQKKRDEYKKGGAGKSGLSFSGRELFEFNPEWATGGDEDQQAMEFYERQEEEEEEPVQANGQGEQVEQSASNEQIDQEQEQQDEEQVEVQDEELFEDLEGLDIDDDEDS
jgi:hypothetical protein